MRGHGRTRAKWCWPWLLLAWLVVATAHAGGVSVHARLDRDHVRIGGVVTLNIEVDGTAQASRPDLHALRSDFDIVGSSRNSSVSIINGHGSIQTQWVIRLRPRHAGQLVIPALEIDGHATTPLTLNVEAAPAARRGVAGDAVFIRVTPSTRAPYVGQQIDLTVKLFYAANVGSGAFNPPRGQDVDVQPLGHGSRYRTTRDGRHYRVLERHYAVTPRHAGPINLAPVTFKGTVGSGVAALFGNARVVTARSAPIRLAVRSRPASWGKTAWLPARKLSLHLTGLPADGQVRAGQSLTLTLTEKAVGLPFEVLPEPQLPTLDGVDVYPGQTRDHTGNDGHWLHGTRKRTFSLVPQQAGTLTIPAITLKWWNVETGKQEVARIPARTLTVVAAPAGGAMPASGASATSTAPPASMPAANADKQADKPAAVPWSPRPLEWLALGLLVSGLLGFLAWIHWRRRRRISATAAGAASTSRQARRAFFEAAANGDIAAQCATLLAWARTERPSISHLGDMVRSLNRSDQRDAVTALQRARYARSDDGPGADALRTVFGHGLVWRRERSDEPATDVLPSLYP